MDTRAALLEVIADEPGSLLVLEGEKLTLPSVATGFLGGMALAAIGGLAAASGQSEQFWRPRRVRADRAKGILVIDDVDVLRDQERSESIPLEQVEAVTVRARHFPPTSERKQPPFSPDHPRSVEVIVHARAPPAQGRDRPLRLEIHGLDSCEKVADLAFRLGTALGLSCYRVVTSDPRRITIEMQRASASGWEAMPPLETPADYVRGLVARAATHAAREYRMPAPDPSHFPGSDNLRLTRWSPGDEVRVEKPMQGVWVGCLLPFGVAALAAGPGLWYFTHDVASTLMLSVFGLLFGGAALIVGFASLPRQVRIAWAPPELIVAGAFSRERIPLSRVSGVVLRCVLRWKTAGSRSQFKHRMYFCVVEAEVRGKTATNATAVQVLATQEYEDQPETPYDAALPLARQLAEALGVPWRVVDYEQEKEATP